MFKNYLTIALRNLIRHKVYSAINILGLAVGMACCMLILLFIQDELSYDHFHKKSDQIYRLTPLYPNSQWACMPGPVGPELFDDIPEIEYVRFWPQRRKLLRYEDKPFYEDVFFVDPNIFDVFTYPFIKGNPQTALQEPNTIVLSERMAKKYFGNEDPIGKVLSFVDRYEYRVTGVLQNPPHNTHLHIDFMVSFISIDAFSRMRVNRGGHNIYTYLMFHPPYTPEKFHQQMPEFAKKYWGEDARGQYALQPLTDIHLHSNLEKEAEPNSDIAYVYIFSATALFILIIACINFMNLTTARSIHRAQEVGMRKVVGANRTQLIKQFLGESLFLALIALCAAILLMIIGLPILNAFANKTLTLSPTNVALTFGLPNITLLVGLLAGSYPAFFISQYQPIVVLKGGAKRSRHSASLRMGLVILQFAISIALMVTTLIVYKQLTFMHNKHLGFQKDQVLVIPGSTRTTDENTYETIKQTFLQSPHIVSVSAASTMPGMRFEQQGVGFQPEGATEDTEEQRGGVRFMWTNFDIVKTLGLELTAGRDFSQDMPTDNNHAFIFNETAAKRFGWKDPINKPVRWRRINGTVIGIVKDFNFASLHQTIDPLCIHVTPRSTKSRWFILVRIQPQNISATLDDLRTTWQTFHPHLAFEYFFLDDHFDKLHRSEQTMGQILGTFSLIAIFIACLGLFGLATFTAEQRTKEIGVRKVLGASVQQIIMLLSKEFLKLVGIANLIAWPLAYWAMTQWLQNFAFRIDLTLWPFILGGITALLIALITVGYQAHQAARTNPIDALRYE